MEEGGNEAVGLRVERRVEASHLLRQGHLRAAHLLIHLHSEEKEATGREACRYEATRREEGGSGRKEWRWH